MTSDMANVYRFLDEHRDESVADLRAFLQQPSISAQNVGLEPCADLLADLMRQARIDTQVFPVPDAGPIVVGQVNPSGAQKTLICYGHYDVQPPDPLDLWTSDPFSAEVRDGKIFARGATDDKGSLFETVKAVEAYLATGAGPPVNVVMVFEGEEEVGSSAFGGWVAEHVDLFRNADGMYGLDGNTDRFSGYPRMFLWGTEDILYVELRLKTSKKDVWAGEAALVPNAAWRLVWALSTLKDQQERIQIEGWYEGLVPPREEDLAFYESLPFDHSKVDECFGTSQLLLGRTGADVHRARYYEPTCTIAGIHSGYGGPGSKTIVPSQAVAKVDFRLLPNQDPREKFELLQAHLKRHGFEDISVHPLPADARPTPFREATARPTWRESSIVQAMQAAAQKYFGVQPILIGGVQKQLSGPTLVEEHGLDCLNSLGNAAMTALGIPDARGWMGDPDSNLHAPNEFISVDVFHRGSKIVITLMDEFAR